MAETPLVKRQKLRIRTFDTGVVRPKGQDVQVVLEEHDGTEHDITPLLNVTSLRIDVSARSGYVTATLTMHDVDLDMSVGVVKMRKAADVEAEDGYIGEKTNRILVEGFKDGWTCHGFALRKEQACPYCKTEKSK